MVPNDVDVPGLLRAHFDELAKVCRRHFFAVKREVRIASVIPRGADDLRICMLSGRGGGVSGGWDGRCSDGGGSVIAAVGVLSRSLTIAYEAKAYIMPSPIK